MCYNFSVKDLGNLHYFLGEVILKSLGFILTQANYVNDILNDELMSDFKCVHRPISASELLTFSDGTHLTNATRYHQVLRTLQYLFFTIMDIAYAVKQVFSIHSSTNRLSLESCKVYSSLHPGHDWHSMIIVVLKQTLGLTHLIQQKTIYIFIKIK